jgi:glutamate N-acetyltransferase/amino-acid N-acetyltransferase
VVAFEVTNATTQEEAKKAATMLSNSLLVKTAIFGEDPNWGRIASTIGASGIKAKEDKLVIKYDNIIVFGHGITQMDEELEKKASKVMQKNNFKISCDLNMGLFSYTTYGCDLSYEYVKINADYRT